MKNFTAFLLCLVSCCALAQVGINTTTPNGSLEVRSTDDGLLIPRVALSATNVATVITPTISELVYNTFTSALGPNQVTPGYYYWDGAAWIKLATGNTNNDWSLTGNQNISDPAIPATYGTSTIGTTENFFGTKDAQDIVFGTNNIERMRLKQTTGNVGIGIAAPLTRLDVRAANVNTTAVTPGNLHVATTNPQNIDIGGSISLGGFFDDPATTARVFASIEGRKAANQNNFSSGYLAFKTNNTGALTERMRITNLGNVGIGTTAPSTDLHIAGSIRISATGTEAADNFLACDATGLATWKPVVIKTINGVIGAGVSIPYNQAPGSWLNTGCTITLPPGKYSVSVYMLMNPSTPITPINSSFWLRSTFANPTGLLFPSGDIIGNRLASGNLPGSSYFSLVTGTIVINNTSGADKTYRYIAGDVQVTNTTGSINGFGNSFFQENSIVATPNQ